VAQRTGERAAEANARTNLLTVRGSQGIAPTNGDLSETIALATAAGAHDEAARAVINYLWSAALLGPLDPAEEVVKHAVQHLGVGLTAEAYEPYLRLSLATLVYVPAGRWREADDVLAASEITVTVADRLVWLWLVTGQALRRGELELTDRHLPEFKRTALASEEPQRILPMVGVAMPRALLAGDNGTVSELADIVLDLPGRWLMTSSMLAIVRSLAAVEDRDRLEQLGRTVEGPVVDARHATLKIADGLVARIDGRPDDASRLIVEGADELDRLGRHYDSACAALEAPTAERSRATALLDRLACVNPF
jgi:hypothetical protein